MLNSPRDRSAEVDSLRAFGISAEPPPPDVFEVWFDNWSTVVAFHAMNTQWQVGFGGPVGLRYEALPVVLELQGIPRSEWRDVFDGVRVMESEALAVFRERRNG